MQLYDNASNGNKTRGSMKKAQDLYVDEVEHVLPLNTDQS